MDPFLPGPPNQFVRRQSGRSLLEQLTFCCGQFWLVGTGPRRKKNDFRGHKSARNAVEPVHFDFERTSVGDGVCFNGINLIDRMTNRGVRCWSIDRDVMALGCLVREVITPRGRRLAGFIADVPPSR